MWTIVRFKNLKKKTFISKIENAQRENVNKTSIDFILDLLIKNKNDNNINKLTNIDILKNNLSKIR